MTRKLYQRIASALQAMENCRASGNDEWLSRHRDTITCLVANYMPSGSGIDSGTTIDLAASKPNRLVFDTGFHHMNDGGMYDGWTTHTVIVTPDLATGFDIRITGRDRNQIKDYLGDVYAEALRADIDDESFAKIAA